MHLILISAIKTDFIMWNSIHSKFLSFCTHSVTSYIVVNSFIYRSFVLLCILDIHFRNQLFPPKTVFLCMTTICFIATSPHLTINKIIQTCTKAFGWNSIRYLYYNKSATFCPSPSSTSADHNVQNNSRTTPSVLKFKR